jgi:hypothetical protein
VQVRGKALDNLCAPACETLALQDFAANVPVKENEFMVYGADCLDLGGSNPPLIVFYMYWLRDAAWSELCRPVVWISATKTVAAPRTASAP